MSNLNDHITLCNRIILDNKDSLDFTRHRWRDDWFHLTLSASFLCYKIRDIPSWLTRCRVDHQLWLLDLPWLGRRSRHQTRCQLPLCLRDRNQLTMGDPTDPGSEVAFSLDTCSIAALLSVMITARDYSSAQLSRQDVWRTSPLSSKKHSRVPFSVLRGPMASSLIVKVLPCSIEMVISSLIAGLARKYRVGTTLSISYLKSVSNSWLTLDHHTCR